MRTKEYILTALMLAMGLILHGIMPPIVGGMKPDPADSGRNETRLAFDIFGIGYNAHT